MKALRYALALVLALGLIAAISPQVRAQIGPIEPPEFERVDPVCCPEFVPAPCTVYIYGQSFLDSDCDMVFDQDAEGEHVDNCLYVPNGDCIADPLNCDVDGDGEVTNTEILAGDQADWDRNGIGNACDDHDGDTVLDYLDNCKSIPNEDQDPEACTDTDGDGYEDPIDNCLERYNIHQEDFDEDGVGDTCDNCRFVANPAPQADSDDDGRGDACPSEDGGIGPGPTSPPATPSEGMALPTGPDFERGSGGCQLMAAAPFIAPWSALGTILAALAVAAFRKKR